jgi:hypothetical protein
MDFSGSAATLWLRNGCPIAFGRRAAMQISARRDLRPQLMWGFLTAGILIVVGVAPWLRFFPSGW